MVVVSAMGDTTDELIDLMYEITDNPPEREMDMLLSTGEQVSIALLAMAIKDLGYQVISLTGAQVGIMTDNVHTKAKILEVNTSRLQDELKQGKIIVVAGFQGVNSNGDITTLGRGGSDTTAVVLAVALKADLVRFIPTLTVSLPLTPVLCLMPLSLLKYPTMRCWNWPTWGLLSCIHVLWNWPCNMACLCMCAPALTIISGQLSRRRETWKNLYW